MCIWVWYTFCMKRMWLRTWFPGLCAVIIVGLVYFFFIRDGGGASPDIDIGGSVQGPSMPNSTTDEQTINQSNDNQKIMGATLHTNMGDISIEFNPNTPKTVENFIKLAKSGFYNGTKFHRVIKGFMSQGGDPLSKDDSQMTRWGTGGPGYQFADEIVDGNRNLPGTIAMANAGPDTNGSQFFLNAADNSFLDTKHTVFGAISDGVDVVMAINNVETGENDRPVKPIVIESITLK